MSLAVFLTFVLIFFGVVVSGIVHICNKTRSRFHTRWSLLIHYFINRFVYLLGAKAKRKLEQDTENFSRVQEKFLLNILERNSQTKYGRQFKFTDITNRPAFTDSHPITRYNHYKKFVGKYFICLIFLSLFFNTL